MRGPGRCKPRQTIPCLGSFRFATVQGAASVALVRRPLAGRALTGLGPAPLAGPVGAKAPWNALFKVAICHAKISASYGVSLYPILDGVVRHAWLGSNAANGAKSSVTFKRNKLHSNLN